MYLFQAFAEPHPGFVAGTLVHTPGGVVRIEDIAVDDMVLARPSTDGAVEPRRVTAIQRAENAHVIKAAVKWPRTEESEWLFPALDHAFWVKDEGWLPDDAIDVKGLFWDFDRMKLRPGKDWAPAEVRDEEFDEPFMRRPVINLLVEEWDSYFVGSKGLCVAGRRIDPDDAGGRSP